METMTKEANANTAMPLTFPSMDDVKKQLPAAPDKASEVDVPDAVKEQADQWMDSVLAIGARDLDQQNEVSKSVKALGNDTEVKLTEQSKLLQSPMSDLMNDVENGSDVANDLLKLEEMARDLDPNSLDLTNMSGIRVFLSKLGMPTPLTRWMAKYQSAESVIKSIETGLQNGKRKLENDNQTLKDDQIRYRKILFQLDDYISFAAYVDSKFEEKLNAVSDQEVKRFLTDEVLFPIRQRYQDLLTSKGLYQQAWVTSDFIIKTNEELIRGVDRALKHTMIALGVAASLALALSRQKKVLTALQSSRQITEKMIGDIADRLLEQGTAIMKEVSDPYIQVKVLEQAFSKTLQAMDEVSAYRAEAIQKMKGEIQALNTITSDMEKNIQRMEKGNESREQFKVLLKN